MVELIALAVSGLSLAVSLIVFWRTELRGPHISFLPVADSTVARMAFAPGASNRYLMNIWRDVLLINDGHRPAFVGLLSVTMPVPPERLGLTRATVGSVGDLVPEEHRHLNVTVERQAPVRVTVSWWLEAETDVSDRFKDYIRDPAGPMVLNVRAAVLEARLTAAHFKTRETRLRPVQRRGELIAWGEGQAYGV